MRQRAEYQCKRLIQARQVMKDDFEAHQRYEDSFAEASRREKIISRIVGVLGPAYEQLREKHQALGEALDSVVDTDPKKLRKEISLWEAMVEYLQNTPEARIGEMEAFFEAVGLPNSGRQAVESALKRHPETFKIRKDKRDKYISLKERAKEGA